jgi:hypothetical protein
MAACKVVYSKVGKSIIGDPTATDYGYLLTELTLAADPATNAKKKTYDLS